MKKILLLFVVAFGMNACSVGDDDNNVAGYFLLAIDSVEIADSYPLNVESEIMVNYRRPTDCYIFDGFYIQADGMNYQIAVQAQQLNETNCLEDMNTFTVPLRFHPTVSGNYVMRFYAGSPNGAPEYFEYTVNVE